MSNSSDLRVGCPSCGAEVKKLVTPLPVVGGSTGRVIAEPCGCELDFSQARETQDEMNEAVPLGVTLRPYLPGEQGALKERRRQQSQ